MASTQEKRLMLSVPVDPAFRAKVERAAEQEGRTIANFVRRVVARAVEQQRGEGAAA